MTVVWLTTNRQDDPILMVVGKLIYVVYTNMYPICSKHEFMHGLHKEKVYYEETRVKAFTIFFFWQVQEWINGP